VRRRKEPTGECDIGSGRIHCTVRQCSFTMLSLMRARRPRSQGAACRRDARTRLPLMRARRPHSQAVLERTRRAHLIVTYAGETPALPGGAWAGATRGGRCVNDLRAAFQDAPGRCAREPMTARCRTWGARHAAPLLIRHRNDDMLRSGRNAPYRSRSGITPIPGSFFSEEERLVRSCRIFYNLPFCKGSCNFTLFPQHPE